MRETIDGRPCRIVHRVCGAGCARRAGLPADGDITINVDIDHDGHPIPRISRKGKLLIAPSMLGFILTDSYNMVRGFKAEGMQTASSDTTWEQPWGERRVVRDRYNELLVSSQTDSLSEAADERPLPRLR